MGFSVLVADVELATNCVVVLGNLRASVGVGHSLMAGLDHLDVFRTNVEGVGVPAVFRLDDELVSLDIL